MTALRELNLMATPHNWRLFMLRKIDPKFAPFRDKVFARDHHTCQYCAFKARVGMDVNNLNGEYHDNRFDNLVTVCPLCVQCSFLESVGKSGFGGGTLVLLPEMTQSELNGLCHVLFQSIISGDGKASDSKNVYRNLKLRSQLVDKHLGEGFAKPSLYGQMLVESQAEDKEISHKKLMRTVRLLPNLARFLGQIETWLVDACEEMI